MCRAVHLEEAGIVLDGVEVVRQRQNLHSVEAVGTQPACLLAVRTAGGLHEAADRHRAAVQQGVVRRHTLLRPVPEGRGCVCRRVATCVNSQRV